MTANSPTTALLSITELYKTYPPAGRRGSRSAATPPPTLAGVSLAVQPGEVVAIVGPSGCGKSTFLRCLNGLEPIDSGSIQLGGVELNTPTTNWPAIRQRIGMVFQNYELFPHLTVLDNLLLAPQIVRKEQRSTARARALALLERVALAEKANCYPRQLSGGQKQRIAIVRALMMEPEVLLFDEVTASLDPEMVREVLEVIQELAQGGMTMLLVTHEMGFAQATADTAVFMDQGRIVETAPAREFFASPRSERARQFLASVQPFGN